MTAADESRVVWRHEPRTEAGQGLLETLDPTDGSALAQILAIEDQAALAARSEPRSYEDRLIEYRMRREVAARSEPDAAYEDALERWRDGTGPAPALSEPQGEGLPHKMYSGGPDCPCPGSGSVYHRWFDYGRSIGQQLDAATPPAEGLDVLARLNAVGAAHKVEHGEVVWCALLEALEAFEAPEQLE